MVSKNAKKLLALGAVIIGGYLLYSAIKRPSLYGARVYPSMVPIANVYPAGGPYKPINVF